MMKSGTLTQKSTMRGKMLCWPRKKCCVRTEVMPFWIESIADSFMMTARMRTITPMGDWTCARRQAGRTRMLG